MLHWIADATAILAITLAVTGIAVGLARTKDL